MLLLLLLLGVYDEDCDQDAVAEEEEGCWLRFFEAEEAAVRDNEGSGYCWRDADCEESESRGTTDPLDAVPAVLELVALMLLVLLVQDRPVSDEGY